MKPQKTTDLNPIIQRFNTRLHDHLDSLGQLPLAFVGVRTGGVWVARQALQQLHRDEPLGVLDISFYRDDFSRIGLDPRVRPSDMPVSLDDRHVILIDDVLHTGRTARAALNALFDYGRPARVSLAVLLQRNGHELPIQPDVCGQQLSLTADDHIKLHGPSPLTLTQTCTHG